MMHSKAVHCVFTLLPAINDPESELEHMGDVDSVGSNGSQFGVAGSV